MYIHIYIYQNLLWCSLLARERGEPEIPSLVEAHLRQSRPDSGPSLSHVSGKPLQNLSEREFFIDNLLVRIHFIIEMIWWAGLAPWEF